MVFDGKGIGMTICIIDYGLGNVKSLSWALERIGSDFVITNDRKTIFSSDKIIVPGVGAFGQAIENMHSLRLFNVIKECAAREGVKLLGICLGMQIFFDGSEEAPRTEGLSLLNGRFEKLDATVSHVPHMGWNNLEFRAGSNFKYLDNIEENADFYFVHSYGLSHTNSLNIATTDRGGRSFVSYVENDNITCAQFHPEKSHINGLRLLKNWVGS